MALRERDLRSFSDDSANASTRGILVATGLGGPGFSVWPLRDKFRERGHDAHTVYPRYFFNTVLGQKRTFRESALKLRDHHEEPLVGVGWSIAGNQFEETAEDNPGLFSEIYNLGSPSRFVKKPEGVTVVSFVGRNGKHDWVIPAQLASRGDHDEIIKVKANHLTLPYSNEVFNAIIERVEKPRNPQKSPLAVVR